MKKLLVVLVCLITVALLALPSLGCIAIPQRPPDSDLDMALPEQRAFIYRQGDTEHMILSVQYNGATEEFAWVIPTETQAKVDVQPGAPFHELWKVTAVKQVAAPAGAAEGVSVRSTQKGVVVLERKQAGPYDIAVLKASTSGGLYKWLRENGFNLNQTARNALDSYVRKDWHFVAARIRPDKRAQASRALQSGTITPLHISYRTDELSYPLRVTAGNPGTSEIELFVLTDNPPSHAGLNATSFRLTPYGKDRFKVAGPPNALTKDGAFPTLRSLIPKGGILTKYKGRLSTGQRQRDLVFDRLAATKPKNNPDGWSLPDDL